MEAVLATKNMGKLREVQALLEGSMTLLPLPGDVKMPEETGETYHDNALLKAQAVSQATGLAALADDSGLEVEALGRRPGIRSARFAGEGATDEENLEKVRSLMKHESDRRAAFVCVLCLYRPGQDPLFVQGRVEGILTGDVRGSGGFGYDPIFLDEGLGKTFAELPADEKNALSHRAKAAKELVRKLQAEDEAGV